jgi:hypothetical protein
MTLPRKNNIRRRKLMLAKEHLHRKEARVSKEPEKTTPIHVPKAEPIKVREIPREEVKKTAEVKVPMVSEPKKKSVWRRFWEWLKKCP